MTEIKVGPINKIGTFSYSGVDVPYEFTFPVASMYTKDLNNDGVNEVIFAGLETQPNTPETFTPSKVSIFGWQNGEFVNLTNTFLPNGADHVQAVGSIAFGDFDRDGDTDMYLSGNADMEYNVHSYELRNNGSYFTKVDMGLTMWEHGTTTGDINHDGYTDVMVAGYTDPTPYYLGGPNGLVKGAGFYGQDTFGSAAAVADFLGNGTMTAIVTDSSPAGLADVVLLSLNTDANGNVFTTRISHLPTPLLEAYGLTPDGRNNSHDVRVEPFDFTHDGLADAVVFSRAWFNGEIWPSTSEIQFYQNLGNGNFIDVTSSRLVGYDTHSSVTYTPVFDDFNNDGLTDIFLSTTDYNLENYNSTSILLQHSDGTFVDTGREELSAAVRALGGQATLTRGPDGQLYMVASYPTCYDGYLDANGVEVGGENVTIDLIPITFFDPNANTVDLYSHSAEVIRLYQSALDRAPEPEGWSFWVNALDQGMSLQQISSGFVNSLEFQQKFYGDGSDSTFVYALYNNVLHRDPEPEGWNFWVNELATGHSREEVLIGFSESQENISQTADLVGQLDLVGQCIRCQDFFL